MAKNKKTYTIEQIRKIAAPILRRYGITRKAVFGSVVHGEMTDDSDIDFLVEFPSESNLLDLVGLEQDLTEALHRKVDVVTYRSLHPLLKERVLKEAISL
ncbi:MAG: nucleotidyltransferase family protein [candidate division Zixibacteria bacterium]|nr:nucleotidyltransferase family protein [candidate division Zixibacteria bacterium]